MKFITWNVNGLKSCITNGLMDYLISADADIIALQETKVSKMPTPFLRGYDVTWNRGDRPGYSGTACLYKTKPLSIKSGIGNDKLDREGRSITVEYPAFYFVNVYTPMSQDNLERWNCRLEWDAALINYLTAIQKQKPVIVCGDFNVAHNYIDIFPENTRNIENPPGFTTAERDGFNALLDIGFSDVFRELHPNQERAYTWWSNRLKKRLTNQGWRLDYFLVSNSLLPNVKSCNIRTDIMGSDHAPVELCMDLKEMNDEALGCEWRKINWKKAREAMLRMQRDIAFSAFGTYGRKTYDKQKRLVNSVEIRALAVKHVCDSMSQPGIDGIRWECDTDKMKAALALDSNSYKAQPMRLIIIQQKGKAKERYIHIPTHSDKAMQALHAFALDPVAESIADRKSFAFRRGRSTNDIHAYIMRAFDMHDPPKYIVKGDVKACYASISHEWLLNNAPMDIRVLKEFLKAGYVFHGELFPPDDFGISLGSSISPILGNLTLDGAQKAIYDSLHGRVNDIDYVDGNLHRFADDIIVTARTIESAEKIKHILHDFLSVRGLELSAKKTTVIDISKDGFDFLSRHYHYVNGSVYATPSEESIIRMEKSIRDLTRNYRGGQKALIDKLNRKLIGWANYHRITEAGEAFRRIDSVVKASLLELCEKLHPHMPREKLINKYFYAESNGEYVYALRNKPEVRVSRIANTVLIHHEPVSLRKNPYIDEAYYE